MNDLLIFYDRQQRGQTSTGWEIESFGNLESGGPRQLVTPEPCRQGGAKVGVEVDRFQSQDAQQMRHKIIVTDERGVMTGQATILQGNRLHPNMRPLSGKEEFAVESQYLITTRRRAFWKDQQADPPAEQPGHGLTHRRGLFRVTPADKQGPDTSGKDAHHRPLRDFLLGDEQERLQ
jgi:hypothetical protein